MVKVFWRNLKPLKHLSLAKNLSCNLWRLRLKTLNSLAFFLSLSLFTIMRNAAHVSFWLSLLIMNRDSYQVRFITTQWRQLSSSTEENFLTEPSNDKSWFPFVLFQSCLYFHLVHWARAAAVGQTQTPSYFLHFHFCIYKSQRAHSTYRVAQEDWWVCKVLLSDAQKMSSTMHSGFCDTIFGFA